ncbi:MAG: amino acid adenylation domain-containing protein, partial [Acidobacteriaceae bacterium]|nr:amino acid adenylation domain-containing protein [Acidobacteriaceae bacterium]
MKKSEHSENRAPLHVSLTATARRTPRKVAVECNGRSLTYEQLERRSNQLARLLQQRGVGPDVLVGLLVERSLEMIVTLLAVLKAGAAYVPLDSQQGAHRIEQILDEAQIKLLVADPDTLSVLAKLPSDVLYVSDSEKWAAALSCDPIEPRVGSSDLAYVIFTSGSTGKPKGVEIEHGSLINLLESMLSEPGLGASDALLAVTTISFDIAGLELYLPLLAGGRLVIASREATSDGKLLAELIARSKITVMQATPVTWRLLLGAGWKGKRNFKALVGGEALSPELARELTTRCGQVWNMYGPTETTIWSSVYRVRGDETRTVPIGKPIRNTSFHILGPDETPVPPEQEGELYIGGEGLARGYLHRPDLTAERFVHHPFEPGFRNRLYRTGDIARCRQDGNVEFLGRTDHQVKIRGFRIELGEIEAVLEQHPSVRQAVAMARESTSGEKYIAAYISSDESEPAPIGRLRGHLRERLPDYMLPSVFVEMKGFPLTSNGKVDRKALPEPQSSDITAGQDFVSPRNEIERKLASIWEEVLNVRPIGVTTSFFDLGGRSLDAGRLFAKIGQVFGKDLPVSKLIFAATVQELARELESEPRTEQYRTLVPLRRYGSRPPFFCVHGGHGGAFFLHNLANELPSDQPFYGIEAEGLDGRRIKRDTIPVIATHYVSEIRKAQPSGPYFLGG